MQYVAAALLLAAAAGAISAGSPANAISLDVVGGDAWTFRKQIKGTIARGACDDVIVRSPASDVHALLEKRHFVAQVPLRSGTNRVQALCRRAGMEVARSHLQKWTVRLHDTPRAWVRTRASGASIWLDAGRTEQAPGVPAPVVRYEWRARAGNPAPLVSVSSSTPLDQEPVAAKRIEIRSPKIDGQYYVTLRATDAIGRSDESTAVFRVSRGKPAEVYVEREHAAWIESAVLYGAVPFFFGPDGFSGLTKRLDAIAALGVTAIWLSPVTDAAAGDFGYAITDHFHLRNLFGSQAEFRALIREAHARGLRIVLDFVPNHVSDRNPYYLDAQRRGRASAYYDWFERDQTGQVIHYFNWTNLETLNYDNPEVRNYITASFEHWLRDYGVDGFRVDASWAVRERAPEFWPRLREELTRIDPDLFLLAEASARDPYYASHGFDAAYDWTSNLGEWAWHDVFGKPDPTPDLKRLREQLASTEKEYVDDILVLRFLNNNDTGSRFLTRHGVGQTRVAAILLFTLPGLPLIYNGDEVGAAFEPYEEGPPIIWRDVYGLTELYARLARMRRETLPLRSHDLQLVGTDHDDSVLAYVRPGKNAADGVLVILNFSATPVEARLLPGETVEPIARARVVRDLLSGERMEIGPSTSAFRLSPYGALVIQPVAPRSDAPGGVIISNETILPGVNPP
jgi:glycosidase